MRTTRSAREKTYAGLNRQASDFLNFADSPLAGRHASLTKRELVLQGKIKEFEINKNQFEEEKRRWLGKPLKTLNDKNVYAIGAFNSAIKIGIAENVQDRIAGLQTAYPEKLREFFSILVFDNKSRLVERLAHRRLSAYRLEGEWFDVSPQKAIETILQITKEISAKTERARR